MATAKPWVISPAFGPRQWRPTILLCQDLFTIILAQQYEVLYQFKFHYRGLQELPQAMMLSLPKAEMASYQLQPQTPYQIGVKTVVGTYLQLIIRLDLLNILAARSFPAMIAVGVSSNLPLHTSPIEKILEIEVASLSDAIILPFGASFTPRLQRFKPFVSADRPMANSTVSYSQVCISLFLVKVTLLLPSTVREIEVGVAYLIKFIPIFYI